MEEKNWKGHGQYHSIAIEQWIIMRRRKQRMKWKLGFCKQLSKLMESALKSPSNTPLYNPLLRRCREVM